MNNRVSTLIATEEDIQRGVSKLVSQCKHMKFVHKKVGMPPLRRREAGFEGLVRIIVGQQLSVAAANAIWNKFSQSIPAVDPSECHSRSDDELRACGLSRPKIKTLRAVCEAIHKGELDFKTLDTLDYDEISEQLTRVKGIGPWTADIYIMFCLGHPDAWAPGDLALQYAVQDILSLEERPGSKEMVEHAERWQPWRGVAARMLWAYYSIMKENKSGIPV